MKRTKFLAVLLLLLVLSVTAFIVTTIISRAVEEADSRAEEEANKTYALFPSDDIDVKGISYTYTDQNGNSEQLSFVLEEDTWIWENHPTVPLSENAMIVLSAGAIGISADYKLETDKESLADYGLDNPQKTLIFTAGDNVRITLYVGKYNTAKGMYYINLAGAEETVYLIDRTVIDTYDKPLTELVDCDVLPSVKKDALQALSYQKDGAETRTFRYYSEGSPNSYPSPYCWYFTVGDAKEAALEESYASQLTSALTSLSFGSCVYVGRDGMEAYGLDRAATVSFSFTEQNEESGESTEQTLTLLLGNQNDNGSFYAMQEGSQIIYTLTASVFETLFSDSKDALLPRRILNPSWTDVASVTVSPAGKNSITVAAQQTEDGQTVYTIDGSESSYEPIESFYNALSALCAEKDTALDTVEEPTASGEVLLTLQLTFNDSEQTPLTLELTQAYRSLILAHCGDRATQLITEEAFETLLTAIDALQPAAENKAA